MAEVSGEASSEAGRLDEEPAPVEAEAVVLPPEFDPEPEPEPQPEPEPTFATVAEPVAPVAEEPHEEFHEEEAGWSFASKLLAALVLLLAGAGLGIWAAPKIAPALPSGMAPVAQWLTPGQSAAEAEIAALQQRVDSGFGDVESRLAAQPAASDLDARIATAVGAVETKLTADIAAAREAAGQVDLTGVNQKLAQLDASLQGQTTELTQLKDQIAGTAGQLSDDALSRIDTYAGQVQALRDEMGAVRDSITGFGSRIDFIEARATREVDAAQAKVAEIQQKAETDVNVAGIAADLARIHSAIEGGQPFAEPLAGLPSNGAPPEGLASAADTGVATLTSLRETYPDAAHAALRASIMATAGEESGVVARAKAFMEAQVSSRSLTPEDGQGTDAVLSRMEDKLRQDDLDGVLAESQQLPTEAAAAMSDWLAAVKKRAAAIDGLGTLDASLAKTN